MKRAVCMDLLLGRLIYVDELLPRMAGDQFDTYRVEDVLTNHHYTLTEIRLGGKTYNDMEVLAFFAASGTCICCGQEGCETKEDHCIGCYRAGCQQAEEHMGHK